MVLRASDGVVQSFGGTSLGRSKKLLELGPSLIPVPRMTLHYEHHRERHEALRVRLRELAGSRVRYGYRHLTILLQREGSRP